MSRILVFFLLIISLNVNAQDVIYKTGQTVNLEFSYVQPNYLSVDGDVITSVSSVNNSLTSESTSGGGVVIVLRNPYEFTFIVQTKNGLVIPVQSTSTDGQGTYSRIIPDEIKKAKKPKKWEKGNSYENELINIAVEMINNPRIFTSQRATNNTSHKFKIEGLKIKPQSVYVGNAVYIVKYQIKNIAKEEKLIDETMFKVDKLRAIFFDNSNLNLKTNDIINMYQIIAME
ncbi:type-F conjugative transfer system secretin TraK [Gilliamella sp. BG7]|uniref:TraK domain-containing protein n=1 Tax=unclassified Gilliamella TaxID=2685620 RepID=UPI00398654CD